MFNRTTGSHPGRRAGRRPRPAGRAEVSSARARRRAGRQLQTRHAVPAAARAARLLAAPVRRHPAGAGRTEGPLDPGVPRLHLLPGRLPDHAGGTGAGAEAVGSAARQHPPARAVRVGGSRNATRPTASANTRTPSTPTRWPPPPTCRRWRTSPGRCRWCSRRCRREGIRHERRQTTPCDHSADDRRARSAGPHGRHHPAAASSPRPSPTDMARADRRRSIDDEPGHRA